MRTLVCSPILLLFRRCGSFSVSTLDISRNRLQNKQHIIQNEPPQEWPIPISTWNQTQYLKTHQRFRKRRSFRRLVEIMLVLSGNVVRPLLCSIVRRGPRLALSSDDFWSTRIRGKTSNAQRVAHGFQQLGPTFCKLGQALATRPDILDVPLADALGSLQDNMRPFQNRIAKRIIRRNIYYRTKGRTKQDGLHIYDSPTRKAFMDSLSDEPVAAASIAQVYKGFLEGYGNVAVKVQRPGARKKVQDDTTLFHSIATWVESLKWPRGTPMHGERLFGSAKLVQTVDEFMARIFEDTDFEREGENMQTFGQLYCHKRGKSSAANVVVPEFIPALSSRRVIVMEWIEGTKLTDICDDCDDRQETIDENLKLVEKAIECTLSQLLDTGILHADPHTGNLLKVRTDNGSCELGYLDFGLVSYVPQKVRDSIVCAVVQLVFARNVEAVADLCMDLELLPEIQDEDEKKELVDAFKRTFDNILIWPKDEKTGLSTAVPKVRFEKLLSSFAGLISKFEFTIPPYFLNNARALATLEGIALELDPNFNILRIIYPYAINRLMLNPSLRDKTEETFLDICRSPDTKLFDFRLTEKLLNDWSLLTGYRKRKIFWDLATSVGGRRVIRRIVKEWYMKRIRKVQGWYRKYLRRKRNFVETS